MQHHLLADLGASAGEPNLSDAQYIEAAFKVFAEGRSSMFRQHPKVRPDLALSAPERAALAAVGLVTDDDSVAGHAERARQESVQVYFHLLKDSLPTAQVAEMLGVNPSRIRQRVRERSLLAFADGGELRIPMRQFVDGREVPGLGQVLQACPPDLKPIEFLSWFQTPTAELPGSDDAPAVSPRDYLLATGEIAAVVKLAKTLNDGEAA